jgi:peptidoglycan/xylan/chitin deacetylase (PgdA/CDA1 family)
MRRRHFLSTVGVGIASIAGGCLGDDESSTATGRTDTAPPRSTTGATEPIEPTGTATSRPRSSLTVDGEFRAARADVGTTIADFETAGSWSAFRGDASLQSAERVRGERALRLSTDPTESEAIACREFDAPRDFSNRGFSLAAKWEAPSDAWYQVALTLRDADGDFLRFTQVVEAPHRSDWHRLDLGVHSVGGDPDLTRVTGMDVMTWVGDGASRVFVDDLRSVPTADTGYVLFTFDDAPESAYTVAYPAMRERGFAGCVGVIKRHLGHSGYLSLDRMDEMAAAGWEFCSHPQFDRALPEMGLDRLDDTLAAYKSWLYDHGFDRGAETMIYPYGAVDDAALEVVADYHRLAFKVERGQYSPRVSSPLLLGRTDGDRFESVCQAIDRAARYGLVVPIMYHALNAEGRISKADFEATVDLVADTDGIEVITPSEYLSKLRAGEL